MNQRVVLALAHDFQSYRWRPTGSWPLGSSNPHPSVADSMDGLIRVADILRFVDSEDFSPAFIAGFFHRNPKMMTPVMKWNHMHMSSLVSPITFIVHYFAVLTWNLLHQCASRLARLIYSHCHLVGGLEHFLFSHILGISSSPLTFIFFRGVAQPPTSHDSFCAWGSDWMERPDRLHRIHFTQRSIRGTVRVDRQVKANRYVRDYHEQWTRVVDALHLPYSCTTCRDVGNNPKFVWSDLLCFMVNQTSIFRLVMVKSSLFGMFHDYLIAFRPIFDGWIVPCMAYISCPSRPLFSRQLRALQMRLQLLGERRELLSEEGKGQAGADGGPRGKASIDEVYMRSSQQPRTRLFFSVIYRTSSLMFFFF